MCRQRPQLGDQSLHRWLHPSDGLLEAFPGLFDHAPVSLSPAASELSVPTVSVLDLTAASAQLALLVQTKKPGQPQPEPAILLG